MRNVVASSLVIALGLILLYVFVMFWLEGSFIIQESNRVVLAVETLMASFIVIFGIERLIHS